MLEQAAQLPVGTPTGTFPLATLSEISIRTNLAFRSAPWYFRSKSHIQKGVSSTYSWGTKIRIYTFAS